MIWTYQIILILFVTPNQIVALTARFSEAETFRAVKVLGEQSSEAQWIHDWILLKHWQLVKDSLKALIEDFYENGRLNACVQENYICLTQKEDAVLVKDFGPISLMSSTYKLVAKVLA